MSAVLQSSVTNMFTTILFDLDGTLTDPGEGITNSVAYALGHFGIQVPEREKLYPFIGPPLAESFAKYFHMNDLQSNTAVEIYREYFSVKGWRENCVYDGIEELLYTLRKAEKRLLVATSKPEEFAVRILNEFELSKYFDYICGAPFHPPKGYSKADVIKAALDRAGIKASDSVIMVGDRYHDVLGAHTVGIPAVGALYGYGSKVEHEEYRADYIVENIAQLEGLLLNAE